MTKLPKIYKNIINNKIDNNKEMYRINSMTSNKDEVLDKIFKNKRFVYTKDVEIVTKNKIYNTSLISRNNNYILTIDNDKISIDDIISIKIKNP